VSAYSGDNASRGALAGFLAAAESGRIPKGSILLVESLDRLSRAAIPEAVGLLTSIVRAGVRVVSLIDGHEWNEKTIEDSTSFLLSVLLFSRAHEESSTKAKRVSEQFQKKRKSGMPVVSYGHGPGWATPKEDRSGWQVDTAKAEVVVRVFKLAAAGNGGIAIARKANQEGWPLPWRVRKNTSTRWEHTGVSRLLRDRRTLGEWQPKRMIAGKLTVDGEPVTQTTSHA
jgi:DNA invertase Pin-like site-specific DNA recombinase